ncbi:ubiquinol-cytochrome C chaperone-domain-containing protein [Boletus coccyginus]|nr:ubiquinol-cytochrome C chaperone-domain-containing protein [Boletus coccyginus]
MFVALESDWRSVGPECPTTSSLTYPITCLLSTIKAAPRASGKEQSWLTHRVEANPALHAIFLGFTRALGYSSPKRLANRRALHMYNALKECALPPTFQSWFTVTNLHVWLLTVRLRALPAPHRLNHTQGLIDHFFQDVEERARAVLQPGNLITRHMKIFKEQWAGMGMSMDFGLVRGDAEKAAAIWRNLLGGRGARGIPPSWGFRRSVNLVGGLVENVEKMDVDAEETRDDWSGVYDFDGNESDRYIAYPELMETLVVHLRCEAQRLEQIPTESSWDLGRWVRRARG